MAAAKELGVPLYPITIFATIIATEENDLREGGFGAQLKLRVPGEETKWFLYGDKRYATRAGAKERVGMEAYLYLAEIVKARGLEVGFSR